MLLIKTDQNYIVRLWLTVLNQDSGELLPWPSVSFLQVLQCGVSGGAVISPEHLLDIAKVFIKTD